MPPLTVAWQRLSPTLVWLAVAAFFVLVGGGNLDPSADDARLGLAAREGLAPLGQVYGGWDPSLWPLHVLPSQIWAWGEGGTPTTASIRWPNAIAGILLGLILALRVRRLVGTSGSLLLAVSLFGSLAFMHRTSDAGLNLILGCALIGVFDRMISRDCDWVAGLWASLAFLSGGLVPLAMVCFLAIVMPGRSGTLSVRLLLPPAVAVVGWSVWMIQSASVEVWASALVLPLTKGADWLFLARLGLLAMPWAPMAMLGAVRTVRDDWSEEIRAHVRSWVYVLGVSVLAGTLIPGFSGAARVTALAAMAVVSAMVACHAWSSRDQFLAGKLFTRVNGTFVLLASVLILIVSIYLATFVSYYRTLSIGLAVAAGVIALASIGTVYGRRVRGTILATIAVAICFKIMHLGIYVPEWNYRVGQGPWGRAVGQWIIPSRPLYSVTKWPYHLMFHTGRPVRVLPHEESLHLKDLSTPQYILLHEQEFLHWPTSAPPIQVVRKFGDEWGNTRVLARTEGDLGLSRE